MKTKFFLRIIIIPTFLFAQVLITGCGPAATRLVLTVRPFLADVGNALLNSAAAVAVENLIDATWTSFFGDGKETPPPADPYADIVSPYEPNSLKGKSRYDLHIEFLVTDNRTSSDTTVIVERKHLTFERVRTDSPWIQTFETRKIIDERTRVGSAQVCLDVLGYKTGPIDGKHGDKTSRALVRFQKDYKLPTTGMLDDGTYDLLMSKVDVLKKNRF